MLDLHLKYDPNISVASHMTRGTTEPIVAAELLKGGNIPDNLVLISEISTNYRDAVINRLVTTSDGDDAERVVQLLSAAIASTPDEMVSTIKTYSEYLAPLSFAWGETVLATRTVLRNNPGNSGSFLTTIAEALNKKMNSEMFKSLIMNSTASAEQVVELEKAQGKY
jgi:hypothetical protein